MKSTIPTIKKKVQFEEDKGLFYKFECLVIYILENYYEYMVHFRKYFMCTYFIEIHILAEFACANS